MAISVMDGGQIPVGSTSVAFSNNTGATVYVNNCRLAGFPAKVGIPNGGFTVLFSPPGPPAAAGTYPYTTSANIGGTPPSIRVQ